MQIKKVDKEEMTERNFEDTTNTSTQQPEQVLATMPLIQVPVLPAAQGPHPKGPLGLEEGATGE